MSVAADNYRVITDTLSNLKRILLIDDDPTHCSKRVHLSPLQQSVLASSLNEVVPPVIVGSATGNTGAESTTTVESVEQELEQGGSSPDEIPNDHSSPVLLSSSPNIHIELSQEECERCGRQKEGAMMVVEDGSVVMTAASVVATDPIARTEQPIVEEEVTIRKRETTPLKESEVSKDAIPLKGPETFRDAIPLKEPEVSKDAIPLKESEVSKDALQNESEHKDVALTRHSLSLEERMDQILTTMDHQITSSDQARAAFKPPRVSPPAPRPSPTLSIARLLFVYINHRGCAVALPPSHHA